MSTSNYLIDDRTVPVLSTMKASILELANITVIRIQRGESVATGWHNSADRRIFDDFAVVVK